MKLYDLKRGDKIKAVCLDNKGKKVGDWITFDHVDGMYSYCTVDGVTERANVIHLSVMTPLKKVDDHYEIDEEIQNPVRENKTRKSKKIPVGDGQRAASRRDDTDRQARQQTDDIIN